ncbi:MAG: MBL fold metallo-hydrolase [Candidatus Omnitrophica bacterium]|nr:MBL fold metallo-hydrolase [Candidatus Omnitrophota bacterium]
MILETICVGPMQVNCYILASGRHRPAIIIDPGAEANKIKQVLDKHSLAPAFIINTHGHYDHIGCDDQFSVPVYIHRQDLALLKNSELNLSGLFALPYEVKSKITPLEDMQTIGLKDLELKVMHMPGHTPGGIALEMTRPQDKIVFTGDSLFCQGIGRSDLAGGSESLLIKSIKEKLLILPDDTVIYPGHGGPSTIGEEKRNNPYLI